MNYIQKSRGAKGFTQESLAVALNVDRSTVAKWETGKSKPRADMLIKLAAILGCTVDELLSDEKSG